MASDVVVQPNWLRYPRAIYCLENPDDLVLGTNLKHVLEGKRCEGDCAPASAIDEFEKQTLAWNWIVPQKLYFPNEYGQNTTHFAMTYDEQALTPALNKLVY